jgi:hypothetical protein
LCLFWLFFLVFCCRGCLRSFEFVFFD